MQPSKADPGRRSVLAAIVSGGAIAVAGCLGGVAGPDADAGDDTANGGDDPVFPDHPGNEPRDPPAGRRCDGPCGMEPASHPEANAQIAHADGRGVFFDSAGCLVSYLHDPTFYDGPDAAIRNVWARDFGTKAFLDATEASFVLDFSKERHEEVMAHNPKPFADRSDAVAYVGAYDDLGEADIVGLDAFGAEQANRYRDYPLPEE
ncbi:nitrous oxide reductase accessory protein NosL [Natronomonas sp. LN261]|jgi:copper chaperone NosL|uniref:nitrous oxide reductase accessory protein NosL n=1 Tax=Natronomonas sp. LN261 TaxID=2750669 RepID=UPI0015EEC3FB|nr:nitrous oxide reductase accessory protein NosL [Natronomonas sp. LN261]